MFDKINIVPRWIIFLLDIATCVFSLALAYYLRYTIDLLDFNFVSFSRNVLILSVINCFVFYGFKIYSGIVRYTTSQDIFKLFTAVLVSNGIFLLVNLLVVAFNMSPLISHKVLIVNCLMSFILLISYRLIIKHLFMYIRNLPLDKKKVIVYGAGEAAIVTKRILDQDVKFNKKIVAFVDDDNRKVGKSINGVKILSASNLTELILAHEVDEIIFASFTIPVERKAEIVDVCLANEVTVLNIPYENTWAGGVFKAAQIKNINIENLLDREQIEIDFSNIKTALKNKRILITGAAGSIGSELVRQLMVFETGLIILCDQSETALHHLHLELSENYKNMNFTAFIGDIREKERMEHLFELYKPHVVFHAAAYKHVPLMEDNPAEAIKTNVMGTKIIADLSIQFGVKNFVMISTDKAVNPTNVMGASKRIAEIYVQSLNNSLDKTNTTFNDLLNDVSQLKPATKFITTRFGNVLGSNGSVIPRFEEQIKKGGPLMVTHPDITRYFMTIPEACRLVLEAGYMGKGGEVFIFDMGKSVKILDLAHKMIRLAGLVPNQDIKIVFTGLRPGEKLYEELLNDEENTLPTHHKKIMIGKVREYSFVEIEDQINQLLVYAKKNNDHQVVVLMKKLVKEFKSKNSVYETIDEEFKNKL